MFDLSRFNFLKVEPPSRKYKAEDVLYVDLATHPINDLQAADRLSNGDPLTWEDLDNEAIASEPDPGTEAKREKRMQVLHERTGGMIVELLNFTLHATGAEVGEDSVFTLVEKKDEEEISPYEALMRAVDAYLKKPDADNRKLMQEAHSHCRRQERKFGAEAVLEPE